MKPVSPTRERIVSMKLYTIGYTGKSAEKLFGILTENKVRKVIDIRLKNPNSYCFYTHKRDLPFLLSLVGIEYEHKEKWAPEEWLLNGYRDKEVTWTQYVVEYYKLIRGRNMIQGVKAEDLNDCALLCAEDTADLCHRRLLAEYFHNNFPELEVIHL